MSNKTITIWGRGEFATIHIPPLQRGEPRGRRRKRTLGAWIKACQAQARPYRVSHFIFKFSNRQNVVDAETGAVTKAFRIDQKDAAEMFLVALASRDG